MNKAIFNTRKISTQFMVLKMSQKDRKKKTEDRCKKDQPARRPKGSGPRPPEDRKLQDRNITNCNEG